MHCVKSKVSRNNMKNCHLCSLPKQLIKKTHIYPDFLYKDLYDENHRIIKVTTSEIVKKNPKVSKPPTGVYEGNLLCSACDNNVINGNYETYIADILFGKNNSIKCKNKKTIDLETIEVENLDYKKVKNFFLSILFRCDICTFEEFNDIKLGVYRDKIRKIVYENLFTNDLEFQINILKLQEDSNFAQLIVQPFRSKIESQTLYSFLLKGYLIIINFKENKTSKTMKLQRLTEDGKIVIPIIPKKIENNIIFTYLKIKK